MDREKFTETYGGYITREETENYLDFIKERVGDTVEALEIVDALELAELNFRNVSLSFDSGKNRMFLVCDGIPLAPQTIMRTCQSRQDIFKTLGR